MFPFLKLLSVRFEAAHTESIGVDDISAHMPIFFLPNIIDKKS